MSGWNLTGRLISKHFSALGDKFAEAIASFDPETATEADRDRLQGVLRDAGAKLYTARAAFDKEHAEVVQLRQLIQNDELTAGKLGDKLTAGEISEASVTLFCDQLEANKAKLPNEEREEAEAKDYLDELQKIVDLLSQQLTEFDANAKKAKQALATAKSQAELQNLRIDRQNELASFQGLGSTSSALTALNRKAQQLSADAAGLKTVADVAQKPIDQAAELDAIRKSVTAGAGESPAQRLARLAGKTPVSTE